MNGYSFFIGATEVDEPTGWDSIKFQLKRTSHIGLDQPFTDSVQFTGVAAQLIYDEYQDNFVNGTLSLTVSNKDWSQTFKLNFALYEEVEIINGCPSRIGIGLILSAFEELVNARIGTEVNLLATESLDGVAIADAPLTEIKMFTQPIFLKGAAKPLDTEGPTATLFFMYPYYWQTSDFSGLFGTTTDPTGFTDALTNVNFVNNGASVRSFSYNGLEGFAFNGFDNVTGGDLKAGSTATYKMQLVIRKIDTTGPTLLSTTVLAETIYTATVDSVDLTKILIVNRAFVFNFEGDISLDVDEGFQLAIQLDTVYGVQGVDPGNNPVTRGVGTFTGTVTFNLASFLNLSEINYDALNTNCSGVMLFDAFERALQIITGQTDPLVSDYLTQGEDCAEWNYLITNGLFIRNADFSAITTSFRFLFENVRKILNIGWEFETDSLGVTRIRIEKENFFYERTEVASSEDPQSLNLKPDVDAMVNQIKIGFTDAWKATSPGGQGEISTEIGYFVANKPANQVEDNILDLRSELIAAGNSIEFMRRYANQKNTGGSPSNGLTTDQPNDNRLFIIAVNKYEYSYPGGAYNPYTNDTSSATYPVGTVAEANNADNHLNMNHSVYGQAAVYNVRIAPSINAVRWLQNLSQFWFRQPTEKQLLKWLTDVYSRTYQIGFYQDCIVVDRTVHQIMSNENRTLADCNEGYDTPLYEPQIIEFDFSQELCDFLALQNQKIEVRSGSKLYKGFLKEATNSVNDDGGGNTSFTVQVTQIVPNQFLSGPNELLINDQGGGIPLGG